MYTTSSTPGASNPSRPGRSYTREIIAWLVIVAAATLTVYRNAAADRNTDASVLRNTTARYRAMILIGTVTFQKQLGAAGVDAVIDQIEEEARTSEERFQSAVLAGEIVGKDRAMAGLDKISTDNDPEIAHDVTIARRIYAGSARDVEPEDGERLISRYGEFGRIALSFGIPREEEPRKSLQTAALRAFVVGSFIALSMIGLAVLSLPLSIAGVVFMRRGNLRRAYVPDAAFRTRFLEAFALYLILMNVLGSLSRVLGFRSVAWNWLILAMLPLLLFWIGKGQSVATVRRALGWHRGRGVLWEMGAGILGYVAGLVFIIPSLFIASFLMQRTGAAASHPIVTPLLHGNAAQVLSLYALACILAPVIEETMFRGVLFHYARSRWSWLVSAAVISLLFAMLHPQGWAAVPALGAIAFVLAGIREWRDSLVASMTAHGLNNFLALTIALLLLRY